MNVAAYRSPSSARRWVATFATRLPSISAALCASPLAEADYRTWREAAGLHASLLQVLGEEGGDGLDGLGDIRLAVVQVDVQPGVQPDDAFRPAHPLMGLTRALRGAIGVLDAV